MDKTISLMPENEVVSGSPFHAVERVQVRFSANLDHDEIYKCGGEYRSNEWTDLYTMSKVGLEKLFVAGGIKEISSDTRRIENNVWFSSWKGKYTTPAGIEIDLSGDYEFDCRIGGTRYQEKRQQEIESRIKKMSGNKNLNADGIYRALVALDSDKRQELEELADAAASRYVTQASITGAQRAQTGARLRALRAFFAIRQYTLKEIAESVFEIFRARVDYKGMQDLLGADGVRKLMLADFASQRGLSEGIVKMLLQDGKESPTTVTDILEVAPDQVIEPDQAEESIQESGPEPAFDAIATEEQYNAIGLAIRGFAGVKSRKIINDALTWLWESVDITYGQALLTLQYYKKMIAAKEGGQPVDDLKSMREQLRDVMHACNAEQRIMDEIAAEQKELPL
jgi:hypothetical protein